MTAQNRKDRYNESSSLSDEQRDIDAKHDVAQHAHDADLIPSSTDENPIASPLPESKIPSSADSVQILAPPTAEGEICSPPTRHGKFFDETPDVVEVPPPPSTVADISDLPTHNGHVIPPPPADYKESVATMKSQYRQQTGALTAEVNHMTNPSTEHNTASHKARSYSIAATIAFLVALLLAAYFIYDKHFAPPSDGSAAERTSILLDVMIGLGAAIIACAPFYISHRYWRKKSSGF